MSDSLAIAAVTATIKNLLFTGVNADVAGAVISTKPPDRVRTNAQDNRVNLFLYQTSLDAAWRNQDLPGVTKNGEEGRPPLPLSLYYLVTAYAENDEEILSHRLLGSAMRVLHDHPVLDGADIKLALAESDLNEQIEHVRVTPQPMTLEEMSKLWTTFQTQYRLSSAYQASVVLIESKLPARAPVPVLTRSDDKDTGPVAEASTIPPLPTIEGVTAPNKQPSARLGDEVQLTGHQLAATTSVRVTHAHLGVSVDIPPPPLVEVTGELVRFRLPGVSTNLPAGLCSVVAVASAQGKPDRLTNAAPLEIAPTVIQANAAVQANTGEVTVTVKCSPNVLPGQNAQLLLSDLQVPLGPVLGPTDTLVFTSSVIPKGKYYLRLRVDSVDSLLVDRSKEPPVFDPTQVLEVQ
jgi:Pvc16 N-terminal domain